MEFAKNAMNALESRGRMSAPVPVATARVLARIAERRARVDVLLRAHARRSAVASSQRDVMR